MTQAAARRFGIRSLALVVMALAALRATGAHADTYPNRPVRLIVPFAAGGLNDVVARLVAPYLERSLGQPFIVDNRPAASGIVGNRCHRKSAAGRLHAADGGLELRGGPSHQSETAL